MSVVEADKCTVVRADLEAFFPALRRLGFETIGPTVRDGAITYEAVASTRDLPSGMSDEQGPGSYRLHPSGSESLFAFAAGAHPWKRFLHQPAAKLFQIQSHGSGWSTVSGVPTPRKLAFFGIRACDLHALSILDRVFLKSAYIEPEYRQAREQVFIAAVHCSHPSGTCFCSSLNAGPRCPDGFDLALTEIVAGEHRFVIEIGSEAGRKLIAEVPHRPTTDRDIDEVEALHARALSSVRKSVNARGFKQLLYASVDHPVWERVAKRCMACGNCTMACPTCFCSTIEESSSVTGETAERWRYWDSCFSQQYSYIHGGSVRNSVAARYRHRIIHKFASWWEQFGTSGCVGCGRCTTWCPAGIDLAEEIGSIRESTRGGLA